MKTHFTCRDCGARYSALSEQAGKAGTCKNCGGEIVVPTPLKSESTKQQLVKYPLWFLKHLGFRYWQWVLFFACVWLLYGTGVGRKIFDLLDAVIILIYELSREVGWLLLLAMGVVSWALHRTLAEKQRVRNFIRLKGYGVDFDFIEDKCAYLYEDERIDEQIREKLEWSHQTAKELDLTLVEPDEDDANYRLYRGKELIFWCLGFELLAYKLDELKEGL